VREKPLKVLCDDFLRTNTARDDLSWCNSVLLTPSNSRRRPVAAGFGMKTGLKIVHFSGWPPNIFSQLPSYACRAYAQR